MLRVILTKGIPGSGKSTWARELCEKDGTFRRVNKDTIRGMLGGKHSKKLEKMVEGIRDASILAALRDGYNVVCDDTNILPKHENHIRELVRGLAEVEINDSFFAVSFEECVERDKHRSSTVGKDVVLKFFIQASNPDTSHFDASLPAAILVDLDGTLAIIPEGASPYRRPFIEDGVNRAVAATMRAFSLTHRIIIMSGRSTEFLSETMQWLELNDISWHALHMRLEGDERDDRIIKRELFDKYVRGNFNVQFVMDDRPKVVRMWRHDLGLTVFQVAPDIDF